ncbi:MAG: ribonuclease III [Candidatus Auribacterota bacterium]|nr:ribonuclease III [Candidatus Auribacterota bacterium]
MTVQDSAYLKFEETINYLFRDKSLLALALMHKSYKNENQDEVEDCNERLEFLGDSVLGCAVATALFKEFTDMDEGRLSFLKSFVVSKKMLALVSSELNLGTFLKMGKGEEKSGGRTRESNLANGLEALIAAIYLDSGYSAAEEWIINKFRKHIKEGIDFYNHGAKNELQEFAQAKYSELPVYTVLKELGPEHRREYIVQVEINGKVLGKGKGPSKKEAESNAACEALEKLK